MRWHVNKVMSNRLISEFRPAFNPKSIAIVGASHNPQKPGFGWLKGLIDAGFDGELYPINPRGGEILGLQVFTDVRSVPDGVDYVIVTVPREIVPSILDQCAEKRAKFVHLYTAGYREADDATGSQFEYELKQKARSSEFRLIGPNCIGCYCPRNKLPYSSGLIGPSGRVGFISQSGGVGASLIEYSQVHGLGFSKGVSFGNGIDLDAADFLEFMGVDPDTEIIGLYIEGSKDGRRLLSVIHDVSRRKPVVIWKGGRSEAGALTAMSHTGSMVSNYSVWSAGLKQAGAIEVFSLDELADALLGFQCIPRCQGTSIAMITIGRHIVKNNQDIISDITYVSEKALDVPHLSQQTVKHVRELLGCATDIVSNPIDGTLAGYGDHIFNDLVSTVLADSNIDIVLVQEDFGFIPDAIDWVKLKHLNEVLCQVRQRQDKPIVVVIPGDSMDRRRCELEQMLVDSSIPVYGSISRVAGVIANIYHYTVRLIPSLGQV